MNNDGGANQEQGLASMIYLLAGQYQDSLHMVELGLESASALSVQTAVQELDQQLAYHRDLLAVAEAQATVQAIRQQLEAALTDEDTNE
jgi:hypothetical protein